MSNLKDYEEQIEPLIQQITKKCDKLGWEFCAVTALGVSNWTRLYSGEKRFISTGFGLHPNILVTTVNEDMDKPRIEKKDGKKILTWEWREMDTDFTPKQLTGYEIIERFRSEELKDKPIVDFVPTIIGMSQMPILYSWAKYFRKRNVPFIITRSKSGDVVKYTLWKERYD